MKHGEAALAAALEETHRTGSHVTYRSVNMLRLLSKLWYEEEKQCQA